MFPSTAVATAPALPSLRAALRQAAELTVAFATLESYTLDDVLPARQTGPRGVESASAVVPSISARELAAWEAPADGWLAEVRPIGTGACRSTARGQDDDGAGAAAALARRPHSPRRPDARLAAAAAAGGWPVAGPRLVSAASAVTAAAPVTPEREVATFRTPAGAEITSLAARRAQGRRGGASKRRAPSAPAEQLSLLG